MKPSINTDSSPYFFSPPSAYNFLARFSISEILCSKILPLINVSKSFIVKASPSEVKALAIAFSNSLLLDSY